MKKTASIFFLTVFLFNWFGYRMLSALLEDHANSAMITELDNHLYDEADLITIKLPSNLPYYAGSNHYQRMDGELEINGIHYNYVKCRINKDSLEYLCIPNLAKTKLSKARDEYYKIVNDLQHPSENKKAGNSGNNLKSLLSEYYQDADSWSFTPYWNNLAPSVHFYISFLSKPALMPQELPPDA